MAEFSPDKFEDKYVHYFTELQQSYRSAFEEMNEQYDSQVVHAIDQQVLNESEPLYNDDLGSFTIELPEEPYERLAGVVVDREQFDSILSTYISTLERELEATFLE